MPPVTHLCPVCQAKLTKRVAQGLDAYVCDAHGVWQPWGTIRELGRRALREADDSDALIEGFIWGRLI